MSKRTETTKRFQAKIGESTVNTGEPLPSVVMPPMPCRHQPFKGAVVSVTDFIKATKQQARRVHHYAEAFSFCIEGQKKKKYITFTDAMTLFARLTMPKPVAVAPQEVAPPAAIVPLPAPPPPPAPDLFTPPVPLTDRPGYVEGGKMGSGGFPAPTEVTDMRPIAGASTAVSPFTPPAAFKPPALPQAMRHPSYTEGRLLEYLKNPQVRDFLEFLLSRDTP